MISSPICRSRQTAVIAFGGYDKLIKLVQQDRTTKVAKNTLEIYQSFIEKYPYKRKTQ